MNKKGKMAMNTGYMLILAGLHWLAIAGIVGLAIKEHLRAVRLEEKRKEIERWIRLKRVGMRKPSYRQEDCLEIVTLLLREYQEQLPKEPMTSLQTVSILREFAERLKRRLVERESREEENENEKNR